MVDTQDIPKPPNPLRSPIPLLLSLAALCSTLHPANPPSQPTFEWYQSTSSAWLKSVLKRLEIDASRLPPAVEVESVNLSAAEHREDWTDEERLRMTGVFVEASLAVDAQKDDKREKLSYTPLARALSHRTLELLGLPAKDLMPEAEKNLSSTLFKALKAANENEASEKVESTRAAHSEGWGGSLGRSLATGAGVVAGGILIGVTGGLAAPAIAAVLAPLGIGGLLGAGAPVVLGTLFGVGGGGLAGRRVRERWKGVEEFGFVEVGAGTKATQEEIEDLKEANRKLQERKAKEKAEEKEKAKKGEVQEKGQVEDETSVAEKSGINAEAQVVKKPETIDEKNPTVEGAAGVEEVEDVDEMPEEEAAKAVEEDRDLLEEKLLNLSLEAGTRAAVSSESSPRRQSLDNPRHSLDQGADEKAITDVKKPPSLTATIVVPGLLTVSRTEAITAWRALCSTDSPSMGIAAPTYAPRDKAAVREKASAESPKEPDSSRLGLKDGRDVFLLRYESAAMLKTGRSVVRLLPLRFDEWYYYRDIDMWVASKIKGKIKGEIIKRTVLNAYFAAVALPRAVYGMAAMTLDNTWEQAQDRAKKTGRILGEVLEKRVQGERPVVLIGSSLGALAILHALQYLSTLPAPSPSRGAVPAYVESAFLISLPSAPSPQEWAKCRSVVARRLVNAWSSSDFVLAGVVRLHEVVSRATTLQSGISVAGLGPVNQPGVQDVDVSSVLRGHMELQTKMGDVLRIIDVDA